MRRAHRLGRVTASPPTSGSPPGKKTEKDHPERTRGSASPAPLPPRRGWAAPVGRPGRDPAARFPSTGVDRAGPGAVPVAVRRQRGPGRGLPGHRLPDRRRVLLPPAGLAGRRAGVQPQHPGHRRARRGQVRHDQGPRAAADVLRGPRVRRRRPEERVRAAGPGPGRPAGRARPRPAGPAEPAGRRAAGREPAARSRAARRAARGDPPPPPGAAVLAGGHAPGPAAVPDRGDSGVAGDLRSFRPSTHGPEGDGAGQARGGAREASPTIPLVWAALRDPSAEMARELRVRGDSVSAAAGDDPPGHRRDRRHGPRAPWPGCSTGRPPCAPTSPRRSRPSTCRGWPTAATRRSR